MIQVEPPRKDGSVAAKAGKEGLCACHNHRACVFHPLFCSSVLPVMAKSTAAYPQHSALYESIPLREGAGEVEGKGREGTNCTVLRLFLLSETWWIRLALIPWDEFISPVVISICDINWVQILLWSHLWWLLNVKRMISFCDINSDILKTTNECKICDLNSIEVDLNLIDVDLNWIEVQAKLKFEFHFNFYWTWELMSQTMEWGPSEITHVIDVTSQLMNSPLARGQPPASHTAWSSDEVMMG